MIVLFPNDDDIRFAESIYHMIKTDSLPVTENQLFSIVCCETLSRQSGQAQRYDEEYKYKKSFGHYVPLTWCEPKTAQLNKARLKSKCQILIVFLRVFAASRETKKSCISDGSTV